MNSDGMYTLFERDSVYFHAEFIGGNHIPSTFKKKKFFHWADGPMTTPIEIYVCLPKNLFHLNKEFLLFPNKVAHLPISEEIPSCQPSNLIL